MTIRTFWTIFIKILGIWLVLDSINVIPELLSTLFFTDTSTTELGFGVTVLILLLIISIYIFILRLFVFKTAWLIDKLKLANGFDEEKIDINIELSTVLTVATIVIGGLIFVDSLPQLCKQLLVFLQQEYIFRESPTLGNVVFYLVKTVLGYLLMINNKQVVAFIHKQIAKEK